MSRETLVYDRVTGEMVDAAFYYSRKASQKLSSLPRPMIISDHMDAAEHPCTGQMIDSKSRFERVTRENGCITIGDDPGRLKPARRKPPDRKAIRESLRKSFARHGL